MNKLVPTRIAAYLAAVFIAGAAAGVAGGYQWGRTSVFKPGGSRPRDMATHMMERYTKELALSPDQVQKVEPLVQEAVQKVRQLHRENFKQTDAIMKGCNERIVELLDDKQRESFRLMEERRKQWMKDRGGDGQRGRPPGQAPEGGHPPGSPSEGAPDPAKAVKPPEPHR